MTFETWKINAESLFGNAPAVAAMAVLGGLLVAAAVLVDQLLFLLLLGVAGVAAAGMVLARPGAGLAILVFATYTRFADVLEKFHGIPSFVLPLALLLLGAILARWWALGEPVHNWETTLLLVGAVGLVGFSSLLYAEYPGRTLAALEELAKNVFLLFAIFLALRGRRALRYTVWALIGAGAFMGTITTIQQITGAFDFNFWGFAQTEVKNIVGSVQDHRLGGSVGAPNYYAMILVTVVPLALDRVWHEARTGLRLLALWGLTVSLLSIVFTYSRGGFVALVVVLALMLARHFLNWRRIVLLAGLLLVVWQFLPANYTDRVATTLALLPGSDTSVEQEVSFRGRLSEMWVAWLMFRDHPLLGVGLNNYEAHYQAYAAPLGLDNRREERSAHNLFLETAAESGIVGLAALGAILTAAVGGAWRARRAFLRRGYRREAWMSRALGIGMVGFLVASFFLHGAYPRYFWLLLGILLALPHVAAPATGPASAPFSPAGGAHAE